MIIKCEINIRPESKARIDALLFAISEDEDVISFFAHEGKETK